MNDTKSKPSRKPFEVGERVAVYDSGRRIVATVIGNQDPRLIVRAGTGPFPVWPQQCRRLKKRERRRVVLNIREYDKEIRGVKWADDDRWHLGLYYSDNPCIEFIEVRRRK